MSSISTAMNRRAFFRVACVAGLALAGSTALAPRAVRADESQTVVIKALNAAGEQVDIEVPLDPQRLAVLDMACLDIIDNLGVGDRVVGIADTSIEYLSAYTDAGLNTLGTVKEADLEDIMACEPDVIFIGGRLSSSFEALSEIAPVVYLATDSEKGIVESTASNARAIAQMFGLEDQVDELVAGFDARIAALKEFATGKTAIVGMCTSGSFNVLGNDGRCSLIGREIGFNNVAAGQASSSSSGSSSRGGENGQGGQGGEAIAAVTATHGNEASFETIVSLDPDYIFVMDRDAAIGTTGASLAPEIMENELVMNTRAYQDGHLVYLEHPGVWYIAEGGVTALHYMLTDLEVGLGLAEAPVANEKNTKRASA